MRLFTQTRQGAEGRNESTDSTSDPTNI